MSTKKKEVDSWYGQGVKAAVAWALVAGVAFFFCPLAVRGSQANFQLCFPDTTWFGAPAPLIDGRVNANPANPGDPFDPAWRGAFRYVFGNGTITPDVIVQGIKDAGHLYLSIEANNLNDVNTAGDATTLVVLAFDPDSDPTHRQRIHIFPIVPNATIPYQGDIQGSKYWSQGTDVAGTTWNGAATSNPSWLAPGSGNVKVRYFQDATGIHWSLEMALPITGDPNTGLRNLNGLFGLYIDVFRVIGGFYQQSSWPNAGEKGCLSVGTCTPETSTPAPSLWGTSTRDASQFQVCKGVSVGSQMNDIFTNNTPNSKIGYTAPPAINTVANTFKAYVQNTSVDGNGQAKRASQVTATFRIYNWGLGPQNYNLWDLPGAGPGGSGAISNNPTSPFDISATACTNPGPPFDPSCILSTGPWVLNAKEIGDYSGANMAHQCIQVELGGGTGSAWQPSHAFAVNATTLDRAAHVQVVTTAGTSGTTEPLWNDTGGNTTDGGVTWKDRGLPQSWRPSHLFALFTTTIDLAGHVQIVTVAGTSGTTQPNWNDAGGNTGDGPGTLTWHDLGPGTIGTVFLNNVAVQNMDFEPASKFERVAEISGKGYLPRPPNPDGTENKDQLFDLHVIAHQEVLNSGQAASAYNQAPTQTGQGGGKTEGRVISQLTWVAHGCRHTGLYMTIEKQKLELCDPVGAFGYVVRHVGSAPVKEWNLKLTGSTLEPVPGTDNTYQVRVPQDGVATVTTYADPKEQGTGKFAVFFDAGAGIPHGTFGSAFNTGFSVNAGLEYIATSHFSAEGIFGYHNFPGAITGDLNLYQFSVNGKAYLTSGTLRPFVNGGVGAYKFSPGSTHFGGNVGAGVLYELTSRVGLQGSYNFHAVNTPVEATKFSTVQGGIRFVF